MKRLRGILGALVAGLLSFSSVARADITTEQKYLLNEKMGSVAKKVQLGTLVDNATNSVGNFDADVLQEATGTLSQTDIQAMNATPVTLLAAPGAGKLIVVDEVELFHDYATAAYTNGGDVTIEYATSGVDLFVVDVAVVTATSDENYLFKTGNAAPHTTSASTSSATNLSTSVNKAVTITNATAAFATGNASNIIKWRIRYRVITLQA